jgi:tetratricopeptide (TPR) repeat protein
MPGNEGSNAPLIGEEATVVREKMEAMRSFESRLELDPHDAAALERLGMLELEVGYHHRALATFERLVEASPMDPAARFWLSRALDAVGRKEDSVLERRLGARLMEQEERRVAQKAEVVPEKGEPGEVKILARAARPRVEVVREVPKASAAGSPSKRAAATEVSSSARFGLEEAAVLLVSIGLLLILVNILVRI